MSALCIGIIGGVSAVLSYFIGYAVGGRREQLDTESPPSSTPYRDPSATPESVSGTAEPPIVVDWTRRDDGAFRAICPVCECQWTWPKTEPSLCRCDKTGGAHFHVACTSLLSKRGCGTKWIMRAANVKA